MVPVLYILAYSIPHLHNFLFVGARCPIYGSVTFYDMSNNASWSKLVSVLEMWVYFLAEYSYHLAWFPRLLNYQQVEQYSLLDTFPQSKGSFGYWSFSSLVFLPRHIVVFVDAKVWTFLILDAWGKEHANLLLGIPSQLIFLLFSYTWMTQWNPNMRVTNFEIDALAMWSYGDVAKDGLRR